MREKPGERFRWVNRTERKPSMRFGFRGMIVAFL
jgi:hypothetical protein